MLLTRGKKITNKLKMVLSRDQVNKRMLIRHTYATKNREKWHKENGIETRRQLTDK